MLRKLCEWKKVATIEERYALTHIHMLSRDIPKMSVSVCGFSQRKDSLIIFER